MLLNKAIFENLVFNNFRFEKLTGWKLFAVISVKIRYINTSVRLSHHG